MIIGPVREVLELHLGAGRLALNIISVSRSNEITSDETDEPPALGQLEDNTATLRRAGWWQGAVASNWCDTKPAAARRHAIVRRSKTRRAVGIVTRMPFGRIMRHVARCGAGKQKGSVPAKEPSKTLLVSAVVVVAVN